MSNAGRQLQVGDYALTDYNGLYDGDINCLLTRVRITARFENTRSQSGVCFKVLPILRNGTTASLYDADWFEPVPVDSTGHKSIDDGKRRHGR